MYILAISPLGGGNFVQIEKQGRIWKKEGKKGDKKKKEKSDRTHVKIPLWSLNDHKKIHKNREEF